jgi:tryptophan 2,3-dioxygenase
MSQNAEPGDKKAITYISYLKVDELLSLQQPESDGEHDEMPVSYTHLRAHETG